MTSTTNLLTLTWWTPEFFSPKAASPAGALLTAQLAAFESAQEGRIRVLPILKAPYGKGGVLDYLRTAQMAAPGLIPDLIALDIAELEEAAAPGMLRPLDGLVGQDVIGGLYPFARQAGMIGNQLLGLQFAADFDLAVFDQTLVKAPYETWAGIVINKITCLFPTGSSTPSAGAAKASLPGTFVSQYLSAGGALDPKTRRLPSLSQEPLLRVLSFYSDLRQAGLIPANAIEVNSLDETWNAFSQGRTAMAVVSARRFLVNQQGLRDARYAAAPGWSSPAVPVASGWALAVVATDPTRAKAAAALITWLMAPERTGAWAASAGWLPTQPGALALWESAPYRDFLGQQLSAAVAPPIGVEYGQMVPRLSKALEAVLAGTSSPAEAVQAASNPK